MAKTVSVIGIDPGELVWVRRLLGLLRHPDPVVSQLAQQAMLYVEQNAQAQAEPEAELIGQVG